mmetsp:Transcript_58848/g.137449  ORF Transcript_58848/g.137449 Transcript_58848/m.137449 type:complete len:177 (+) Transcript_58848:125-655(+)
MVVGPWIRGLLERKVVQPCREMTVRQTLVAAAVGAWGGLFPIPPTTSPATVASIFLYQKGVPERQKFNAPMWGIAMFVNELITPICILCSPGFMCLGDLAYTRLQVQSSETEPSELQSKSITQIMEDLPSEPADLARYVLKYFGLGCAVWAVATPVVLGNIRLLGACAEILSKCRL